MTAEKDVIQMLVDTIKEFRVGSLKTQQTIMENAVHQTQLYQQMLKTLNKQTKILERNSNIRYV